MVDAITMGIAAFLNYDHFAKYAITSALSPAVMLLLPQRPFLED